MARIDEESGPDLELFVGQAWSAWGHAKKCDDNPGTGTEGNHATTLRHNKEIAKLKRQDFKLFGYCPAKDNFYVVVCEHCHLPIKPQAFRYHLEIRHKEQIQLKDDPTQSDSFSSRSTFSGLSGVGDKSFTSKSPTFRDTSRTNSTCSSNTIPSKSTLSHAIKQALHKVSSPPSSSPLHCDVTKSNSDGIKFIWDSVLGSDSPSSKSYSLNSRKRKSSAILKQSSQKDELKATVRATLQDKDIKPSKTPEHNSTFPSKPFKLKRKKIKTNGDNCNFNCRVKKQSSHSQHSSCKNFSVNQSHRNSEFLSAKNIDQTDSCTKQNCCDNDLAEVQGKSPVLEKSMDLQIGHSLLDKEQLSKLTVSSSSRSKKQKHHHNPQLDIVKSSDRGGNSKCKSSTDYVFEEVLTKTKPPVRGYDPNKHCGVLLSNLTRCTQSLTCKAHLTNPNRNVPGRTKPLELITDQAEEKQRLKKSSARNFAPSLSFSETSQTSSSTPSQRSKQKSQLDTSAVSRSTSVSVTCSKSVSKTKNSLRLFPRSSAPHVVDCWQKSMSGGFKENLSSELSLMDKHPPPILHLMQQYGSHVMRSGHASCKRKSLALSNTILSLFSKNISKNTQTTDASHTNPHTNLQFAPVPSVSRDMLSGLKEAKNASLKQKRSNKTECRCSDLCHLNSYAKKLCFNSTSKNRPQKDLSKSVSVVNGDVHLPHSSVEPCSKLQRSEHHTIDCVSRPPLAKSPRCSLPLNHGLPTQNNVSTANHPHGNFIHLPTATSNVAMSTGNSKNFRRNSFLSQQNDTLSCKENDSSEPASSRQVQSMSFKTKRLLKTKKLLLPAANQSVTFAKDFAQSLVPENMHLSNNVHINTDDSAACEVPIINGFFNHTVSDHATGKHTVAILERTSDSIQTNAVADDLSSFLETVNFDQQDFQDELPNNFVKQLSYNTDKHNNHVVTQQSDQMYFPEATKVAMEIDGNLTTVGSRQLSQCVRSIPQNSLLKSQVVSETTSQTMYAGVGTGAHLNSHVCSSSTDTTPPVKDQDTDLPEDWAADLLSFLDPGGGHDDEKTFQNGNVSLRGANKVFPNEHTNIAK